MDLSVPLALTAAVCYGSSDFLGGLLSRGTHYARVGVAMQGAAAVAIIALVLLRDQPSPGLVSSLWGAAAGVGGAVGTLALYRGLAAGTMNIAAPLSAVGAAGVPVIVDVSLGERLSAAAIVGVLLALPGVWLVSRSSGSPGSGRAGAGVVEGLLAGVGFATLFIGLDMAGDQHGLWPVASSQVVSFVVLVGYAAAVRPPPPRVSRWAVAPGLLAVTAVVLFTAAAQLGSLTLAAVITSLYPAVTVLLARVVLREETTHAHALGMALCASCVVAFAIG
ncbi:MAG: EamA family transporter [Ornithinimicrobium sp.]